MYQTQPPFCVGPTAYLGCLPTTPPNCVGPTGWHTCTVVGPSAYPGCNQGDANAQIPTFPVNQCLISYQCNQAAAQTIGQTGWYTCGQPIGQTGWYTCGQPIGKTAYPGCNQGDANAQIPTFPVNQW